MSPLAVVLPDDDEQVRGAHGRALAALPGRFRVVSAHDSPDVQLISCAADGWAQQAVEAVGAGRLVVLARPGTADAGALGRLAATGRGAGSLVTMAQAFAADPGWQAALPALQETAAAVLDSVVTVADPSDLDRALPAQVAALRPLLDRSATALTSRRGRDHYVLSGRSGDCAVSLAGVVSAAGGEELRVDLVGAVARWQVCIPGGWTAAAARVARHDADGEHALRPRFGGALRAVWIEVHRASRAPSPAADGLAGVLADLALLDAARPVLPIGPMA